MHYTIEVKAGTARYDANATTLAEASVDLPESDHPLLESGTVMVAATVVGNWIDGMGAIAGRLRNVKVKDDGDEATDESGD